MNDGLLEYEEVFFGNLTLPEGTTSSIRLIPSMATVAITDNNAAVIGFSRNYNLELEVLSGNLGREVHVYSRWHSPRQVICSELIIR